MVEWVEELFEVLVEELVVRLIATVLSFNI